MVEMNVTFIYALHVARRFQLSCVSSDDGMFAVDVHDSRDDNERDVGEDVAS